MTKTISHCQVCGYSGNESQLNTRCPRCSLFYLVKVVHTISPMSISKNEYYCQRCSKIWFTKNPNPTACYYCGSRHWNIPRNNKVKV